MFRRDLQTFERRAPRSADSQVRGGVLCVMKFTPDTDVHPGTLSNFSRFTQSGGGPRRTWTAEPGVNTFFLTFNGRVCASSDCEWDGEWDDFAR